MSSADETTQYFDAAPTTRSKRSSIELVLPDLSLTLLTDSGVFGRHKVDPGTKLLLMDGPTPTDGDTTLLDVGAGYGPIALTLAKRNPTATVWAVEVNERARSLCRDNAEAAGLENVRVSAPDDVPDDLTFDRIWSNPPIRIGKPKLQALMTRWLTRLEPNGTAHLVVQTHLGSDSLARWLDQQGWPTTRRASRAGYRLLDVAASAPSASSDESAADLSAPDQTGHADPIDGTETP